MTPYLSLGQWIARWVSPFISIQAVFDYRLLKAKVKGLGLEEDTSTGQMWVEYSVFFFFFVSLCTMTIK